MKTWMLIVALVLVAALAFAAGYFFHQQTARPAFFGGGAAGTFEPGDGQFPPQGFGGAGQAPELGERISGEVVAIDSASLTIENSSGSMTFALTETTRFSQVGTYAGFQVGDFVQVSYQSADDGNVALSVDTFAQN